MVVLMFYDLEERLMQVMLEEFMVSRNSWSVYHVLHRMILENHVKLYAKTEVTRIN
jgi:hypothetical protein